LAGILPTLSIEFYFQYKETAMLKTEPFKKYFPRVKHQLVNSYQKNATVAYNKAINVRMQLTKQ